jgi:hypothetical protein
LIKKIIPLFITTIILSACAPSQAAIQTAIAQTQSAYTATSNIPLSTPALATPTTQPTNTPLPSPTPNLGSVDLPVAFGQKGTLIDPLSGGTFDLQVDEVVRGERAIYLIQQASTKNLNPPQGMEYILIHVTITLEAGNLNLNDTNFIVSSNGNLSDSFSSSVCCMTNVGYQLLHADLSSLGSSADGWIVRMAFINDPQPLLGFRVGANKDLSGVMFFALSPTTQSP